MPSQAASLDRLSDQELEKLIDAARSELKQRTPTRPLGTEDARNRASIGAEGCDVEQLPRGEASEFDLDWVFAYHAPGPLELSKYRSIRSAAKFFATVLLENVPRSPDRHEAIYKLRECVMMANAAIALRGRSL